jgi:hypothetical protein
MKSSGAMRSVSVLATLTTRVDVEATGWLIYVHVHNNRVVQLVSGNGRAAANIAA